MDLEQYYIGIVLIACLIIGYVIKNTPKLSGIANDYIPLIVTIVGAFLGCVANQSINLESIVYGALSGLASTGMHQLFTNLINKNEV